MEGMPSSGGLEIGISCLTGSHFGTGGQKHTQFFPRRDRDDCPASLLAFGLPPPPADHDLIGGDATTPEEPNTASSLFEGGLELVPDPIGHLCGAPTIIVIAAIVIIIVVNGTLASTLSSCIG